MRGWDDVTACCSLWDCDRSFDCATSTYSRPTPALRYRSMPAHVKPGINKTNAQQQLIDVKTSKASGVAILIRQESGQRPPGKKPAGAHGDVSGGRWQHAKRRQLVDAGGDEACLHIFFSTFTMKLPD